MRAGNQDTVTFRLMNKVTGRTVVEGFRRVARNYDCFDQNPVGAGRRIGGGATSAVKGKRWGWHTSGDQVDGRDSHTAQRRLYGMGARGGDLESGGSHGGTARIGRIVGGRDGELWT